MRMRSSTASRQLQLLVICKHEDSQSKPDLWNSAHLMGEKMTIVQPQHFVPAEPVALELETKSW